MMCVPKGRPYYISSDIKQICLYRTTAQQDDYPTGNDVIAGGFVNPSEAFAYGIEFRMPRELQVITDACP